MSEHVSRVRKLYKFILRLHRNLPDELRILGDSYAKEEFKRHKKCKPEEAHTFLNEWRDYALSMSSQAAPARVQRRRRTSEEGETSADARPIREVGQEAFHLPRFGHDLDADRVLHMTPEQLYSFYELQCHARGITPPVEPIDEGIAFADADIYPNMIHHAHEDIVNVDNKDKENDMERVNRQTEAKEVAIQVKRDAEAALEEANKGKNNSEAANKEVEETKTNLLNNKKEVARSNEEK